MLRHRRLRVKGDVRHGHAMRLARREIEVVRGRGARGDEAQPRVRGEEVGGDFRIDERREHFRVVADVVERGDEADIVVRQAVGVEFLLSGFGFDEINNHARTMPARGGKGNREHVSRDDKTPPRCEARRSFMHAHDEHEHEHEHEGEWKEQLVASGVCAVFGLAGWWASGAHAGVANGLFAAAYFAGAWFTEIGRAHV